MVCRAHSLPGWRTLNTDFPNYYLAAVLRSQGNRVDRAYEWIWFQRQKDHNDISQPLVGFVPNPPLCAAPMLATGFASSPPGQTRVDPAQPRVSNGGAVHPGSRHSAWLAAHTAHRRFMPHSSAHQLHAWPVLRCGFALHLPSLLRCLRGHPFTAGTLLAAAAWFKVFPAVFLLLFLLFLRKRDWRAVAGLIVGSVALAAVSMLIFGLDIHRVWLFEVLPRAFRGDMVGPYDLQWSSSSSLWHRLFLFEPELNPVPFLRSPLVYAVAQRYAAGLRIRIVLDNHSAHISKQTRAYLASVPNRFEFIFTPKHGSWLNLIESFFGKLARTLLRGIRVSSKAELKARIELYLKEVNEEPVVFKWTYKLATVEAESVAT